MVGSMAYRMDSCAISMRRSRPVPACLLPIGTLLLNYDEYGSVGDLVKSWSALPDAVLKNTGKVSGAFLVRSLVDYHAASRYVYQLPYGRNTDRINYQL